MLEIGRVVMTYMYGYGNEQERAGDQKTEMAKNKNDFLISYLLTYY